MEAILKYPRTQHLEGSRLQAGDDDLEAVRFSAIAGRRLVVEEKMDGANCAFSFDEKSELRLQSRGHYLTGGPRERHFDLFKQWAGRWTTTFWERFGVRYVVFGEWLYAKHAIFYDRLPHYFLEFDIYDRESAGFLSTIRRRELLQRLPIVSVRVIYEGEPATMKELTALAADSAFISSSARERLVSECLTRGIDPETTIRATDLSGRMEGLYVKTEADGIVTGRYKFVRHGFLQAVLEADGHWLDRRIIPNLLAPEVDIFCESGPS